MKKLISALSFLFISISFYAQRFEWAKKGTGPDHHISSAIATDKLGNSYVAGSFQTSVTFGTFTVTDAVSVNDYDIYIVKYSPAGVPLWLIKESTSDDDMVMDLEVYNDGNILLAYGGYTTTTLKKIDPNGNPLSTFSFDCQSVGFA